MTVVSGIQLIKPQARSLTASLNASKDEIRSSLKASTLDGVFASLFSNITGGVLFTNFLLALGASTIEIGILASIPMLANLMQPLGAFLSERTTSRYDYSFWVYSISRSLWILLPIAIFLQRNNATPDSMIVIAFGVAIFSGSLGALGSASWLSWMSAIVPRSLRGRYFGLRNSVANLTNLISVPLLGLALSKWQGGLIQGYSIVLILGIGAGLVSLYFQNFMLDVDPHTERKSSILLIKADLSLSPTTDQSLPQSLQFPNFWQDPNFLKFLLYFNLWTFTVNLSAPFFNVYLLNDLALDISQVTLYNSLSAGANLLLLMFWGRLADRIGNRPILIMVGIIFAIVPLLWLTTSTGPLSLWVCLPLLHLITGGAGAAIDLCSNNLQMGIAPNYNRSAYFAIAAALAGISGALGSMLGGYLAQFSYGLLGLFALSSMLRLGALLPLVFVHE